MRASLAVRLLAVAWMLFATAGIGALAPASACACGGVANPPGRPASVREETALVGWDGHRETGRNYLTELRVSIDRPADIRSDFAFEADATDTEVYQTTHRTEDVELFGLPAGIVILGAVFVAAIVVVFAIVRVLRA